MGFLDSFKKDALGMKAYRTHVNATQLRRQGKAVEAEAKLKEALKMYDEAYAMGFRKPSQMLGYAILTMQMGNIERARELMLECSKDKTMSQPDRYTLRVNFSVCQWKMGQLDKAIETIRRAASEKMSSTIYTTLGMYLVDKAKQTGDFEEALAFNLEAMDYDDEDADTLDNMGQLYLAMSDKAMADGDADKAASDRETSYSYFKKANKEKPDQVTSSYYLAMLENERGNVDIARKLVEKTLKTPRTALCPVTKEHLLALQEKIG